MNDTLGWESNRRMRFAWRERSFEVLPALSVRREALRRNLRLITLAWMFGIVWMAAVTGSQMTTFCWMLGFRDLDFGLRASICFAVTFAQLWAASGIERTGLRKFPFIFFASVHRLLYIPMALIPFILPPGRGATWAFMGLLAVSAVLAHLSAPAWNMWMGDLIPRRIRGRYFAMRRVWSIPVQVVVVLAAGWLMDLCTLPQPEGARPTAATQPYMLWAIVGLFIFAAICGTIDVLLFRRVREVATPPLAMRPDPGLRLPLLDRFIDTLLEAPRLVWQAFGDPVFRYFALYSATIMFATSIGGDFFMNNALKNIGYTKVQANFVLQVCGALSGLVMARRWGRIIDSWGRRPVLILTTMGVVLGPVGWLFIPPHAAWWVCVPIGVLTSLWGGVMWGAVELCRSNVILGFADSAGRGRYSAAVAVVSAVGGALGAYLGGVVAQQTQAFNLHLGPLVWKNYHLCFILSGVMRAFGLIWLVRMPDPQGRPVMALVRSLLAGNRR